MALLLDEAFWLDRIKLSLYFPLVNFSKVSYKLTTLFFKGSKESHLFDFKDLLLMLEILSPGIVLLFSKNLT